MSSDVLADLDALRRRTRGDRHAYSFPLFLFGGLILLAPVCYLSFVPTAFSRDVVGVIGPFPQFAAPSSLLRYPHLVGWYWIMTIVGGLSLTSWWYRQRARRHGVETDVRVPLTAAIAGLLGFLAWQPLFSILLYELFPDLNGTYSTPAVNLPILFGAAAIATAAGLWSRRRTGGLRAMAVAVAAFFAAVAFGALGVYLIRGYAALVVIAVALLVLAWAERSVLLAVVSVLFGGAALLVNLYNMENVFYRLGWDYGQDQRAAAFQSLVLPAVVLLAGGAVAVVRQRR